MGLFETTHHFELLVTKQELIYGRLGCGIHVSGWALSQRCRHTRSALEDLVKLEPHDFVTVWDIRS